MANVIDKINAKQMNPNVPEFRVGDTLRVDVKIIEGKRTYPSIRRNLYS